MPANAKTAQDTAPEPDRSIQQELSDWRRWGSRGLILVFAALVGLSVVALNHLADGAQRVFAGWAAARPWLGVVLTPLGTMAVVWLTRRWAPGAAGSGIPQVLVALDPGLSPPQRGALVSLPMSLGKLLLTPLSLLAGLSVGREGPAVQIGAGLLHHVRRYLPDRQAVGSQALLAAGGAAGVAAAFNAPLAGVVFAIEQLSRRPEQRTSGLLVAAIVLAGLMALSFGHDGTYFGRIAAAPMAWPLVLPGLAVTLSAAVIGGLFARAVIWSLLGHGLPRPSRLLTWRQQHPVWFAGLCGLGVGLLGLATGGLTLGSGDQLTQALLSTQIDPPAWQVPARLTATWLSIWSGAPGGVFGPSLSLGAGIGHDVAQWAGISVASQAHATLIALGMVAFLAAVTQAPLTAFIIVMEMVEGHALVLSLMAAAVVASGVARLISPPLYSSLTALWRPGPP